MEIKITNQQQNPLLKRKEIKFEVEHTQTKGTPQRIEVRNQLAEMLKTKPELVYIKRVQTKTGTRKATGEANAYETLEQANKIEQKHIIARTAPKEKKEETAPEEKKAEAPPPPPKKPTAAATEKPAEPPKKKEE
jgi:small subunit ribosomal protein S24e